MREIRFRAKRVDDGKWIYGGGIQTFNGKTAMLSLDDKGYPIIVLVKRETVGQYVGFPDKKKREVYSGDIVRCEQIQGLGEVIGVVNFGVEKRSWYNKEDILYDPRVYLDTRPFRENNGSEHCLFHANPEVIGNIWDNSELFREELNNL